MNLILRWCKGLAEVGVGKSTNLHNLLEAIGILLHQFLIL